MVFTRRQRHGPVYVGGWVTSIRCVEEEEVRVGEEERMGGGEDGEGGKDSLNQVLGD